MPVRDRRPRGTRDGVTDPDAEVDASGDGDGDEDLAAPVASLERTVADLRETVERQRRDVDDLAAAADLESVEPGSPECDAEVLRTASGLIRKQVSCPECGLKRCL